MSDKKYSKKLLASVFVLGVILSIYFVAAAIDAPTGLISLNDLNDTINYDSDGTFFVNWTAGANGGATNYTIFVGIGSNAPFASVKNDTTTGYTFSNSTEGNYSFVVQAENSTDSANSTDNFWIEVDTTKPLISYNATTSADDSGANQTWIFVNVSATDANNESIIYQLWNTTGILFENITDAATMNWTGLATNKKYTFNVTMNDSATNENSTATRTFYLDDTKPSATATCDPDSINPGDSFPCSCSGSDNLKVASTSGSSDSDDGTGTPDSTGTFTYTCTVKDKAGFSATSTKTYSVNSGGSSSSSSSSGSGSSTTSTTKKNQILGTVSPGAAKVVKNFDPETGLKEISIEVNNEATNVKITVNKHDGKPAAVSVDKSGKVYQYLEINEENIGNKLSKATVTFKVEKSWMSDNGLNMNDVAVSKFDETNEEWKELGTSFDSEDDDYYYYNVELDSFSYFAISEKTTVSEEGAGDDTSSGTSGESSSDEERDLTWLWVIIAVIIIIAAAAGGGIAWSNKNQK